MVWKYGYLSSLAVGIAMLPGSLNVQAQSLNYGISISSLPAQVGQPFTVSVSVPLTVPDGTAFTYSADPQPYTGTYLQASAISTSHHVTIQAPVFVTPGLYRISVGQAVSGNPSVGVITPLALNNAVVDVLVSPAGQSPDPAASFTGNYAFLFKGQTIADPGVPSGVAVAGTFTSDGKGNITAGTLDLNTAVGLELQNAPVTGTYQLDTTGKGSLLLMTTQGVLGFNLFATPGKPGVVVSNATVVPIGGFTGAGEISRTADFFSGGNVFLNSQDNFAPFPFDISAGFSVESAASSGFLPGASLLEFTLGLTAKGIGQAIPGSADLFTGANGTYSSIKTERFTMTLSAPGQPASTPTHYAVYQGSAEPGGPSPSDTPVLYLLSLDPHSSTDLVVGKIQR